MAAKKGIRFEFTGHGKANVFVGDEQLADVFSVEFKSDAGEKLNEIVITIRTSELTLAAKDRDDGG
jgi:hypothetical protein